MKVLIAQINPIIGDLKGNVEKILNCIEKARAKNTDILVFPEAALSGYPPEDLLFNKDFISQHENFLQKVIDVSKGVLIYLGVIRTNPSEVEKPLFNSCAIICDGKLLKYYDKHLLPTYDVFRERRYFEPGSEIAITEFKGKKIAVTICEDIWHHGNEVAETHYRNDPIVKLLNESFDLHVNLTASPYHFSKRVKREKVCIETAKKLKTPFIQCCQVGANDQIVFDGYSLFVSAEGKVIARAKGFEEDLLFVDTEQKEAPSLPAIDPLEDLFKALVLGVRDYFYKQGFTKACFGVSGGIDSALVAAIAKEALGATNVLGVAMPSRYSSEHSLIDAKALCQNLGIELITVPIEETFSAFNHSLQPVFKGLSPDITEENLQARIRGCLLMSISNKFGYLVLSTGNKSELSMGYCTLYGDMCGALSVIGDVLKTQVYDLCYFINRHKEIIPESILTKTPSAELRPNQKDSDSLPEYSLLDKLITLYIEQNASLERIVNETKLSKAEAAKLIERIHRAEYKRMQAAPLIKVSKKTFRIGRVYPIVEKWRY